MNQSTDHCQTTFDKTLCTVDRYVYQSTDLVIQSTNYCQIVFDKTLWTVEQYVYKSTNLVYSFHPFFVLNFDVAKGGENFLRFVHIDKGRVLYVGIKNYL